jgi:hypothetical protein
MTEGLSLGQGIGEFDILAVCMEPYHKNRTRSSTSQPAEGLAEIEAAGGK